MTDAAPPDAGTSSIGRRRAAARGGSGAGYHQRREDIISAAATVFRTKGYRGTSIADVAEAVGVDRATLYYYVGGKEELLDEIVTDVVTANLAVVEQIRDSDDPAPAKLASLVTGLMRSYAEHYPFLYVYLQENLAQVAEHRKPWAREMRVVNRRYEVAVTAIIDQGVAEGSLRAITTSKVLAYGLMGMVSWTHRWFSPEQSTVGAAAIGQAFAQLLLQGLEAVPPDDGPAATAVPRATPHPDVTRLVRQFAAQAVPTYDTVSVLHARALLEGVTALQGPKVSLAQVRDVLLPGAAGLLPARVYHPDPGQSLPLVVYLHGGGFVLGSIRAADGPCRALAAASGCAIVALEYRRAPETKFPGPLQDCVSAVRWIASRREELGGNGRLVVLGDSAGGNLAAATALVLRDEAHGSLLDGQVLLYPCLAPARGSPYRSYVDRADGPLLTRREMEWFWDHYLRGAADATDPRAAPLLAADLSGLPATTLVVCELDPLRDEGLAYADRLSAAGVPTTVLSYAGAAHGFWWLDGVMEQAHELTAALAPILRGPAT